MIMISLHHVARALLLLALAAVALLVSHAPELLEDGGVAVIVGTRAAGLYVLTVLTYLSFPKRRRIDLTCFVIFASWAFELRDPAGAYELLVAKLVGDTVGAVAVLTPSYVERLRALDRNGGELVERRRWRPSARRARLLGLPAPARAPFGSEARQK
jgi:hypothetical protein